MPSITHSDVIVFSASVALSSDILHKCSTTVFLAGTTTHYNMAGLPPEKPYDLKRGKFVGSVEDLEDPKGSSSDYGWSPSKDARERVERARISLIAGGSGATSARRGESTAASQDVPGDAGEENADCSSNSSSTPRLAVTEEDIRKEFEEVGFAELELILINRLVRLAEKYDLRASDLSEGYFAYVVKLKVDLNSPEAEPSKAMIDRWEREELAKKRGRVAKGRVTKGRVANAAGKGRGRKANAKSKGLSLDAAIAASVGIGKKKKKATGKKTGGAKPGGKKPRVYKTARKKLNEKERQDIIDAIKLHDTDRILKLPGKSDWQRSEKARIWALVDTTVNANRSEEEKISIEAMSGVYKRWRDEQKKSIDLGQANSQQSGMSLIMVPQPLADPLPAPLSDDDQGMDSPGR